MEANDSKRDLFPLAVLLDELKADDVTIRVNAMSHLSTIAIALGPERTRLELVPFLAESVEDDDEVLSVLASELGNFVKYVGGPQYGYVILNSLGSLASIEEPAVRDKAVSSINKVVSELSENDITEHVIPMIKQLSTGAWFTSRVSAAGLYTTAYSRSSDNDKKTLREMFKELISDDTPMVRRATATACPSFVKKIDISYIIPEMLPLFEILLKDNQDSVRLLTVDFLIALACRLKEDDVKKYLLPHLQSLFDDKSWRVRYMVADRFEKISEAIVDKETIKESGPNNKAENILLPRFVDYMKDPEAEVRTAIANQVSGFANFLTRDQILNQIIPGVEELVVDVSQHVRAALATEISGLAPLLGKEATIEHLLPIFLQMLKDEYPDVRLNIICKLQQVNKVIGIELLSQSLLPAIDELAQDKQWRVRLAIIEYIPLLASQLGVEFFDNKLQDLCMAWLWDPVYSIREAAATNMKRLTEVFGVEWAKSTIIPLIVESGNNANYLFRITILSVIANLTPIVSLDVIKKYTIPFVHQMSDDPIPNIRFNVAKAYKIIIIKLLNKPSLKDLINKDNLLLSGPSLGTGEAPKASNSSISANLGEDSFNGSDSQLALPTETDEPKLLNFKARSSRPTVTLLKSDANKIASEPIDSKVGMKIINEDILPDLKKLQDDEDIDVRFFADKSLEEIE